MRPFPFHLHSSISMIVSKPASYLSNIKWLWCAAPCHSRLVRSQNQKCQRQLDAADCMA